DMRGPFVDAALAQIAIVPDSLKGMASGLAPHADAAQRKRLDAAVAKSIKAFAAFETFLKNRREALPSQTAVGGESYRFFLSNVALY
ncbi:hypothetical protein NL489_28300, partial [Klebsiella pneumoniae]|nr:hypothetical protein [Klebsiella pneumoniae]